MATYSEVSITGYNANPPSDDGSATASNEVTWAKHKTKIGDPLKTAIETTQTNISTLATEITAELIEAGTAMLFMQTAAPTGWTKDTTANLDDTSLRLVTGTVSSRTDQSDFSTVFGKTATDATTLTTTNIPAHAHGSAFAAASHDHTVPNRTGNSSMGHSGSDNLARTETSGSTNTTATNSSGALGVSGTTTNAGSGGSHAHDIDIRVNYHDCIKATKD